MALTASMLAVATLATDAEFDHYRIELDRRTGRRRLRQAGAADG